MADLPPRRGSPCSSAQAPPADPRAGPGPRHPHHGVTWRTPSQSNSNHPARDLDARRSSRRRAWWRGRPREVDATLLRERAAAMIERW